jgi:hypothetical protein
MKVNEGIIDRIIRIILGLTIIIAGFFMHSLWGLIGIVPLATGLTSRCGLYYIFGINTCSTTDVPKN